MDLYFYICARRHAVAYLVEDLCYSRKIGVSIPNEIIEFFN
jgi:hypothetical protein